jgi:predicted HicB family RNase H-like nuclease
LALARKQWFLSSDSPDKNLVDRRSDHLRRDYEGTTVRELKANFVASVDRYLADCEACGQSPNRPCSGVFQVRIGPERHRAASQAAAREQVGLNEFVARAIDRALESPRAIDVNRECSGLTPPTVSSTPNHPPCDRARATIAATAGLMLRGTSNRSG